MRKCLALYFNGGKTKKDLKKKKKNLLNCISFKLYNVATDTLHAAYMK